MSLSLLASFGEVMSYVGYIALAVLILLVMITVHEFGHYVTGKIFGFGIEEFAIGFGPKLYSKKKKNGEIFSIRLLPLGGFCSFKGEDEENDDEKAFNNKKPWQRIFVLISGALMNYLLAVVLIAIMFSVYGQSALVTGRINVSGNYCFQENDVILQAEGKNVYMLTDLMKATKDKNQGDEVVFRVYREKQIQDVTIKLLSDTRYKNVEDVQTLYDAIGVEYHKDENGNLSEVQMFSTSVKLGFFATVGRSFEYSFKIAGTIFTVLGQLITGALGLKSMGGTITTIGVTAQAIKLGGFRYLLNIASFIGVNLAVFNLLPIPALDGSRTVFTLIEWIRRKPINRRVEGLIHTIGFVLLLLFAVLVDLQQCF